MVAREGQRASDAHHWEGADDDGRISPMNDASPLPERPQTPGNPPGASDFERALTGEIVASEALRVRVLAATLAVVLAADMLAIGLAPDVV